MSTSLDALDPRFRPWAVWLLQQAQGAQVTSTWRSRTQQRRLWRRSLNGTRAFPAAPPGQSKHQEGLAIDLVADSAELSRLGAIWRKAGGIWGGSVDPIHFEAGPMMLGARQSRRRE